MDKKLLEIVKNKFKHKLGLSEEYDELYFLYEAVWGFNRYC